MTTVDILTNIAAALLSGRVLHGRDDRGVVTAGNGIVVDWRAWKSGEVVLAGADAYDTAWTFADRVGYDAALKSLSKED